MKTKLFKFLTLSFLIMFQWSFAQMSVTGTVSDEDGVPIPGATVLVVGTTNGVTTDFDGNYAIMANEGDVLSVSYVGYTAVETTVGSASTINFTLSASTQLDEVVVSGVAGATSRKKLSVTVATLSAEDIEAVPASSASGALMGKVAGVSITNLGRPGSGATIILRGAANFYGTQEPLIIMDGVFVEGGLDDINVDDIASFEIVKGAAASALYGSRAGNGVIVISTKRGKIGKTNVSFRSETGFNKITNYMTMNNSHGWELASDWESAKGSYTKLAGITYPANFASVYAAGGPQATIGARTESADNFADNPYGVYNDFQDLFFVEGVVQTNYISVSSGTEIGLQAKKIMESGGLVSDEIVLSIVKEQITQNDCKNGFILDGFPRTVNQAEQLDALLSTNNKLDCVLRIKVDEEEIIKRLIERGREDDKPEIITNRFKTYNLETQPLIPFYEKKKILFDINGMQEIEKVSEDIKKVIGVF